MSSIQPFAELQLPAFDAQRVAESCAAITSGLSSGKLSLDEAIARWEAAEELVHVYGVLTFIHFSQDCTDAERVARKKAFDHVRAEVEESLTAVGRALISGYRDAMVERVGKHSVGKFEVAQKASSPAIVEFTRRIAEHVTRYSTTMASAKFAYDGKDHNLGSIGQFRAVNDRSVREGAARAKWGWFADHRTELDATFDALVKERSAMAEAAGFASFTEYAYASLGRHEFGPDEVKAFRDVIKRTVVPEVAKLRAEQAQSIGVEKLMLWDEEVLDPNGVPGVVGDEAVLRERAQVLFDELEPRLGDFFRTMNDNGYFDLSARDGKAPGGYCARVPGQVPFVFANFNGGDGDARVFTHEMGHAYQGFRTASTQRYRLQRRIGPEMAEIHSMSLEYLSYPHLHLLFGEEADRFRRAHALGRLFFLPYACAVDEFQHWIYEEVNATAQDRADKWLALESVYLPWRNHGDLPHASTGRYWQGQRHIYQMPFYYIDYALASVVSLQVRRKMSDMPAAMETFEFLCAAGNQHGLVGMLERCGLHSPFDSAKMTTLLSESLADPF